MTVNETYQYTHVSGNDGCCYTNARNTSCNRCACQNNTQRTYDQSACGCGSIARNNSWRTYDRTECGCGCTCRRVPARCLCEGSFGNNTWRTYDRSACGCGCSYQRVAPRNACGCSCQANLLQNTNCSCGNRVTVTRTGDGCKTTGTTVTRESGCNTDCNHGAADDGVLSGKSLASVYSPHQNFHQLYDPREGLCNGTVFCELDKPFLASGDCK